MPSHQKVGLVVIFLLGLLAMVMSIMRTVWIVLSFQAGSALAKYDQTTILTLALMEGDMVIIIGCIPTLRSLMNRMFTATWSFHSMFTRSKPHSRGQTKKTESTGNPGSAGQYLELDLINRNQGISDHSGNVQISAANFSSRYGSEDGLVNQSQVRKTEHFYVSYDSAHHV